MKSKIVLLTILTITLAGMGAAFGDSTSGTVNLTAEVTSIAELILNGVVVSGGVAQTVDFPASNPRTTPSIPGSATTTVTANVRTGSSSTATLTAVASGPLSDGTPADNIPISNVTSTYSGAPGFFTGGSIQMAASPGVTVGSGGSGSYTGAFTWALANSWSYQTYNGSYTAAITYTLLAP